MMSGPLVLIILDGFGKAPESPYNAITTAHTPQWNTWMQTMPHITLDASSQSVGLPEGQMGNSEVGHMHIGAGRIIDQDLTRIQKAVTSGTFQKNPLWDTVITQLLSQKKNLHIMGLLSPGGVHSHEDHLFALLPKLKKFPALQVVIHLFLDGRDTPPRSAQHSISKLTGQLADAPQIHIGSLSGRYYAMDRDNRWERIEPVIALMTHNDSPYHFDTPEAAIQTFYAQNLSDEFIPPSRIGYTTPIQQDDAIFFFNFRADRARQLTQALLCTRETPVHCHVPQTSFFISMCPYGDALPTIPLFPNTIPEKTLGECLANAHLRQLRIAETEKYAHVTFFFNGGREEPFAHEERILIPSMPVATYDLAPSMRAPEITQKIIECIQGKKYDVIICNYANADMVGHTGNFEATVAAITTLDRCLQALGDAVLAEHGCLLITADHGNAEKMFNSTTRQAHTAHTLSPVPCVFVGKNWQFNTNKGSLIDIAPTVLALLNIPKPDVMTGQNLLEPITP